MNRKPNIPKCVVGTVMVALLVIGGWATTTTHLTVSKSSVVGAATPIVRAGTLQSSCGPTIPPALCDVFEIEGNAVDDSGAGLPEDWNSILSPAATNAVPPQGAISGQAGSAVVRTFVNDLAPNDQIFTQGGSKDFNDISAWRHTTGSVPDKDQITHGGAALYIDPTPDPSGVNHHVLVFFADRFDNSGDSNLGFWFFQNPISVNPDGTFSGVHSDGDIFILSAFTKGGGTSTIRVLKWVGNHAPTECTPPASVDPKSDSTTFPNGSLCDITAVPPGGTSAGSGIVNGGPITVNWPYAQKGGAACGAGPCSIPQQGLFYEGGIDLTNLGLTNTCFSSFLLETRSSADVDAVLKDFALGTFNTCPAIQVTKTASPTEACAGTPITYTYSVTNPSSSTVTVDVTLVDDNGTPSNPSDDFCVVPSGASGTCGTFPVGSGSCSFTLAPGETKTCTKSGVLLPVGTTTNTVNATATFGGFTSTASASATVIIDPNPTCTVSPVSQEVCAGGTSTFTVTPTGGTAPYTISWMGPGGFTAGNVTSITVGVTGTYTASIVDAKGCTTSCSGMLLVNPTPACSVSVNPTQVCVGGSATFTATPTGGTPGYSFLWDTGATTPSISVTTTSVGNVSHSVTITDSKGCMTSCTGTLRVNPNPTVTINSVTCNPNASTVTLTATPSGGSGSFTFQWSGGSSATTPNITVGPGTYTVTITDASGCTAQTTRKVGLCTD